MHVPKIALYYTLNYRGEQKTTRAALKTHEKLKDDV